jgi:antitoxin HigA-1
MASITVEDVERGAIDFSDIATGKLLPPIHPGEVLAEEFMAPLGLSAYALAKALNVPRNRITAITNGQRAITAETALRLARYFGTGARMWLNMQAHYDLEVANRSVGSEIEREVQPRPGLDDAAPAAAAA